MFGNLFSETGLAGATVTVEATVPPPPGHRLECKFAGIENQGATCYLNSLLQTLFLTPEFRDRLFALSETDLGCLQDKDKPNGKVRVIPLQLQRLFSRLLLSDLQSVSTADLTNSFGWTNQEEFQQHDVQELNRILFSAIEESLVGTPGQNIINELYHGTIVNQIICSKCKKISEREEDYLDLTLSVAGVSGLEAALKQCYSDVETMDGRNQYWCEACKAYTDATKGAKLRNLPAVLTLSLLRFSFDLVNMTRYKENGRFTFPLELDMSPYYEKGMEPKDGMYELFSVVVHRGSAFGGHYFAYIRDIDNIGHWTHPDNSAERKVDPSATGLDVIECQSPVDLIENILGKVSHHSMSIDKLCAEISKVTGVPWNKRFRKVHGPINKFLKSCDSFDYNPDSNWVSLRGSQPASGNTNVLADVDSSGGSTQPDASTKPIPKTDESSQPKQTEPQERWFCFNDSRVGPIYAKDIAKQFSGKESAYMLFYRKKSLQRPVEAHGCASYKVPAHLMKEVEELNDLLDKQRKEYEITTNSIKLRVFSSQHFNYDTLLLLKPEVSMETASVVIEMDRRKTVGDLKTEIQKVLDQERSDFILYRMKARIGGYHLYDQFVNDDSILQDVGLNTDALLFIWDGTSAGSKVPGVGEACEPLQVLVKTEDDHVLCSPILPKNLTVSHLYQAVAEATDIQQFQLELLENVEYPKRMVLQSSPTSIVDAGIKDGDIIVLSGAVSNNSIHKCEVHTNTTQPTIGPENNEPLWSITLHARLLEDSKPLLFQARPSEMVRDLKRRVLEVVQLDNTLFDTVRLREEHRTMGLQPPLREGLSLADAGLSSGAVLVLERGRCLQDAEMMISVIKVETGKLLSKREFIVDRQMTGAEMLQVACQLMDCQGNQWYLSKTDMYGDAAEPLDDLSCTLMDLLINDGDIIILQKGFFVKKDQVCLSLWLAPVPPAQTQISPEINGGGDILHHQEAEDKVMLELAAKLSLNDHLPSKDLNPLSETLYPPLEPLLDSLVISKSMGVGDFKEALLGEDKFQTLRIPTCNFMRLRHLENSRLKAVLRNNSQIFKHTTSQQTLAVAVQILNSEENLGVHEILLMVSQKIGGTRIYMPAREFLWNTSGGLGAGDLKKAIATRLSLPLHDVLIAKYNAESWSWTVLKDQVQKSNKNKGKKKSGGHKSNIRQAPYYVQDGDLIGVKLLSADKGLLEPEDFSTQEDVEKQQQLMALIEEKKKLREERKKDQALDRFPAPRRHEAALTIKVDKFS
ncbi:ubiquitin carboxyl-terminal hydrolase 40-like isoform X2 [Physella acuta]|uniref:ubiquitin carboxyl-terminal hydrolase 40-like isoform X2 n=1 Tax=Physella acuta TaxID=109671 RepID=UPI0027DDCECF|nr:ubiquitin carboxyl-terminal hydrolase 40-like isoform X2 [Physella acuta]